MAEILIRPETTPNPQTMRFSSNVSLTDIPSEFKSAQETFSSPLARKLFGFPWTAGVFIGRDFVTVTKQDWVDWETLAEPLAGLISEHLERGEVVISQADLSGAKAGEPNDNSSNTNGTTGSNVMNAGDSAAVQAIKRVINEEIRPAVAQDGGDVAFSRFEDGVVYLFMQGSCAGCPSATMTLKMGIETRLKEAVPEVREVVSLT